VVQSDPRQPTQVTVLSSTARQLRLWTEAAASSAQSSAQQTWRTMTQVQFEASSLGRKIKASFPDWCRVPHGVSRRTLRNGRIVAGVAILLSGGVYGVYTITRQLKSQSDGGSSSGKNSSSVNQFV